MVRENDGPDDEKREVRWQRKLSEHEKAQIREEHKSWLTFIAMLALGGITLGIVLAAMIIQLDVNGIGSMLSRSPNRIGFTLLFAAGLASTFGMVVMGVGIMIRSTMGK